MNNVQSTTIFTIGSFKNTVETEYCKSSQNQTVTRTETSSKVESSNNKFKDTRATK